MANFAICKIEGCDKPAYAHGWCMAHYHRWRRHGDPLAGGTLVGEPKRFLREVVLAFDGNECLKWPYATTRAGYGVIRHDGQTQFVHRLVCEARHGALPSLRHQAAHSCGKGHEGCVNPRHIRWATRKENEADKLIHGTLIRGERHGGTKLTEPKIKKIRALEGRITQREIAERFEVSRGSISDICRGTRWGWLD